MIPHFYGKSWKQDELLRSYCTMIVQPRDDGALEGRDSVWWVLMGSLAGGSKKRPLAGWGEMRWGGNRRVKDGLIHLLIKPQKLYQEDTCPTAFQRIQWDPFLETASHPHQSEIQVGLSCLSPFP